MKPTYMMKHCVYLLFVCWTMAVTAAFAQPSDTVFVAEFGAKPYTFENNVTRLQQAIQACKERHAKVLAFDEGRYDFWPEGAVRKEYYVSNTSTERECPSKIKTVGLLFEELEGLTVVGKNTLLMFHGKMIMLAFDHCRDMQLKGLHFDFERPSASEITYTKVADGEVEVSFHRDSRYEVADGKIHLYGEGWRSNLNHCIEHDNATDHFYYSQGWNTLAKSEATEVAPGTVRFKTPAGFFPKVGNTLTVRDIIRDQVGMFIYESQDITLEDVRMHYMHGLGIVSQYTRNVTMKGVKCVPRETTGRILASSADMMHFSGCSGKVSVLGCTFSGAHDDPINVHGTNLRAVEKVDDRTLVLRFMHGQSYGFNAYFQGDTVAFVRPSTMERYAETIVSGVKRLSERTVQVTFDRAVPAALELDHDCVENMTCTPEVEIRGCYFTHTSARGTLVTTPRKVVIADNTYYKTGMSAILIEGDAEGWYESGPVKDVLIENNTFVDCAYQGGPAGAVIALHPSNTVVDARRPVHRNVRIVGNTFRCSGNPVLYAKSTSSLVFTGNKFEDLSLKAGADTPMAIFNGCSHVKMTSNEWPSFVSWKSLRWENMPKKELKVKF